MRSISSALKTNSTTFQTISWHFVMKSLKTSKRASKTNNNFKADTKGDTHMSDSIKTMLTPHDTYLLRNIKIHETLLELDESTIKAMRKGICNIDDIEY